MILIDWGRCATTLWFNDGLTTLKGNLMEVAEKIYNIATVKIINEKTGEEYIKQEYNLCIDYFGHGQELEDILKNQYKLKIERCKIYKNHKDYDCDKQQIIKIGGRNENIKVTKEFIDRR